MNAELPAFDPNQVDAAFASTNSGFAYEAATGPRGLFWPPIDPNNAEGLERMQSIAPFFSPNKARVGANIDGTDGYQGAGYAYPVLVNNRYVMDPSPTPKFDNPKIDRMAALQLYGAGREKRIYAIPPYTEVKSLDFEDYPFEVQKFDKPCGLCGAENVYLDEVILDDRGGRMFVCSDSDFCEERREAGHLGPMAADPNAMTLAGGTSADRTEEPTR